MRYLLVLLTVLLACGSPTTPLPDDLGVDAAVVDLALPDGSLPDLFTPDLTSDLWMCSKPSTFCRRDSECCSGGCNFRFPADAGVAYCCLPQGTECDATPASCCGTLSCRLGAGVPTCLP